MESQWYKYVQADYGQSEYSYIIMFSDKNTCIHEKNKKLNDVMILNVILSLISMSVVTDVATAIA